MDQTVHASVTSVVSGYHPGMDEDWITADQAAEALGVGRSQLGRMAHDGVLTRTFDRPDAPGRPRYRRESVAALVGERARLTDPEVWMTRAEVCALLEITPRAWVDLRRDYGIGDNGSTVARWLRYDRAEVNALARLRRSAPLTRFLTESQAAEKLGMATGSLRQRALRNPRRFGFNARTKRYSAARVDALTG